MIDQLKSKWQAMPPNRQRMIRVVGIVGVVLCLAYITSRFTPQRAVSHKQASEPKAQALMPRRSDTSMDSMAATIQALEQRMTEMERGVKSSESSIKQALENRLNSLNTTKGTEAEQQLAMLSQQVATLAEQQAQRNVTVELPMNTTGGAPTAAAPAGAPPMLTGPLPVPNATTSAPTMRIIGKPDAPSEASTGTGQGLHIVRTGLGSMGKSDSTETEGGGKSARDLAEAAKDDAARANLPSDAATIPSGSIIQGVLLNGLDAPTGGSAQKNPVPVVVRIKHDAIVPNRYTMDIKECFVLASGHGVMSTERAEMRTEKISCVRSDGGVVEGRLDGYLVGQDGKVGIRGRLVTRQGQLIAKSLVAGLFSGMSTAMKPQRVPALQINPGNTTQYQAPDPGSAGIQALMSGGSSAFGSVAQFYLDMAKEMFPVVEVDAGRKVTIVLVNGATLKL